MKVSLVDVDGDLPLPLDMERGIVYRSARHGMVSFMCLCCDDRRSIVTVTLAGSGWPDPNWAVLSEDPLTLDGSFGQHACGGHYSIADGEVFYHPDHGSYRG